MNENVKKAMSHLVATVNQHYPALTNATRTAATVCAVRCLSNNVIPTSLIYVGVPSSGKSMVLEWLTPQVDVADTPPCDPEDEDLLEPEPTDPLTPFFHRSDKFTPASFVSQHGDTKKKDLHDVDLLPKLRGKTLVTPELATIFSGRRDDLIERLSMLVRVLDGQGLLTDAGTHGSRGYGKPVNFQWLGATTPPSEQVLAAMSKLGPRILYYEVVKRKTDSGALMKIVEDEYDNAASKKACREAMIRYVLTLYREFKIASIHMGAIKTSKPLREWVVQWALAVCSLRVATHISKETPEGLDDHHADYMPPCELTDIPEEPYRVIEGFNRLMRASCIAHGRTEATEYDLAMIRHIALSSGGAGRGRAFAALLSNGGKATVSQILEYVDAHRVEKNHVSRATVIRYIHELLATDLADATKGPGENGHLIVTIVPHLRGLLTAPQYRKEPNGTASGIIPDSGPDTTLD